MFCVVCCRLFGGSCLVRHVCLLLFACVVFLNTWVLFGVRCSLSVVCLLVSHVCDVLFDICCVVCDVH